MKRERELEAKLPQILEEIEKAKLAMSQNSENLSDSSFESNNPLITNCANPEGKSGQLTELNPSKPPINVPQFKITQASASEGRGQGAEGRREFPSSNGNLPSSNGTKSNANQPSSTAGEYKSHYANGKGKNHLSSPDKVKSNPQPVPHSHPANVSSVATPPQENKSPKSKQQTLKRLLNRCDDYGVVVNGTIIALIKSQINSSSEQVVLDALEALKEHKRNGQVHNPLWVLSEGD